MLVQTTVANPAGVGHTTHGYVDRRLSLDTPLPAGHARRRDRDGRGRARRRTVTVQEGDA
jgi:hypothetical protein